MVDLSQQINQEIQLYVNYCRAAARHDEFEEVNKRAAHKLFYHIQEMRTTGQATPLSSVAYPIS